MRGGGGANSFIVISRAQMVAVQWWCWDGVVEEGLVKPCFCWELSYIDRYINILAKHTIV